MISERLAISVVELLSILCRADGVDDRERSVVRSYLTTLLPHEKAEQYMRQLEVFLAVPLPVADGGTTSLKLSARLVSLAKDINEELTASEKIRLMLVMFGLVNADATISDLERDLLYATAEVFNIGFHELGLIERFVFLERPEQANHKHFLLLSEHPLPSTEKGHEPIVWPGLHGILAFCYLEQVNLWVVKYLGHENYKLDAAPMLHNQPLGLAKGSSIRGGSLQAIHHAEVLKLMRPQDQERRITFVAEKVSYKFANGKEALHTLDINEESGRLVGLMGPSGSGKSTLLEVLIGLRYPSTGQVRLNGYDVHARRKATEGLIGYVPQDDMLVESLTVYQNMYYAAKLSFSQLSDTSIDSLIARTLTDLGIAHLATKLVGAPHDRNISGGERKRVNMALELLRSPAVLFLDEPTSGLSSRDSLSIMDLLKELTFQGKLIFVVIHQPSSDIFKLFDRLVILDTGGYPIYYGDPIAAVTYFKQCIHQVDAEVSVCPTCANINPEQVFDIIEGRTLNHVGHFTHERRIDPATWYSYFLQRLRKPAEVEERKKRVRLPHKKPSVLQQWLAYLARDAQSKLSNGAYLWLNTLTAPLLALVLAFVNRNSGSENDPLQLNGLYNYADNDNVPAYFFMSVLVAIFLGLTLSATEYLDDRKLLRREHFLHLSRLSYVLSKVTILFTILGVQMALYTLLGNRILQVQGMDWEMWSILFPLACGSTLTTLIVSTLFRSAVTVYVLIPILLIPQILLGGAVIPYSRMQPWLAEGNKVPLVAEFLPSRWGYEALMVTAFSHNPYMRQHFKYQQAVAEADVVHNTLLPQLMDWHGVLVSELMGAGGGLDTAQVAIIEHTLVQYLKDEAVHNPSLAYAGMGALVQHAASQDARLKAWQPVGAYLEKLQTYYKLQAQAARKVYQNYQDGLTATPESRELLRNQLKTYHNKAVDKLMRNTGADHQMVWYAGRWQPEVYPGLLRPRPDHAWDVRTHFFSPYKQVAGFWFATPPFNVAALWALSFMLFLMFYLNLPQWLQRKLSGRDKQMVNY